MPPHQGDSAATQHIGQRTPQRLVAHQQVGAFTGTVANLKHRGDRAQESAHVADGSQPRSRHTKRNHRRGMAVNDGHHIRPGAINLAVDEALDIGAPALHIVHVAVQVAGQNIVSHHQCRGHAAGDQKALGVGVVTHADVAKTVEHAFVHQNVIGHDQVVNDCGIE